MSEDKVVEEYLAERNRITKGRLTENELLLNAWEYSCIAVVNGADPDSPDFTMYALGRRMIQEKMNS